MNMYFIAADRGVRGNPLTNEMWKLIDEGLTRREKTILHMRFNKNMHIVRSQDEICTRFDITQESIDKIEAKAFRRLVDPFTLEYLISFLLKKRTDRKFNKYMKPTKELSKE